MGRSLLLAALAATIPFAHGHFRFVRLAHNGEWLAPFRYIRNATTPYYEPTNPDPYDQRLNRSWNDPSYFSDIANSVRCGRGNMDHAASTEVLQVKAGDTFEFVASGRHPEEFVVGDWDCEDGRGFCIHSEGSEPHYHQRIVHPGPSSIYLSKVPEKQSIESYDGSGEFVKIHTVGVEIHKNMAKPYWIAQNNTDANSGPGSARLPGRMPFSIPKQTPAGRYLMRIDFVYNYMNSPAQLYPACAQIEVMGDTSGVLPKGVKFPEVYDPSMPGMNVTWQQGSGYVLDEDYVYPGGDLWDGETMIVDKPDFTPI